MGFVDSVNQSFGKLRDQETKSVRAHSHLRFIMRELLHKLLAK